MTQNVMAGIVTYNPDVADLAKNIEAIINQVAEVTIVDNGSDNLVALEQLAAQYPTLQLVHNAENQGIAAALNQLMSIGKQKEYSWVLTLDQDSLCPANLVAELESAVQEKVAVISPQIIYINNESVADTSRTDLEETDWVISSASLTSVKAWQELGGFDEKLFIDGVDRDFCIRAGKAGYRILRNNKAKLEHELGNLKCISLLGKTIYVTHHSPVRKYYMARNVIYLDHKLNQRRAPSYLGKLIFKTLVYENQKIQKASKIFRGIIDGLAMKRAA